MSRVDFFVSNPRHHASMTSPVVERLTGDHDLGCRVLSLCEVRGLPFPAELFHAAGASTLRLIRRQIRRGRIGAAGEKAVLATGLTTRLARRALWSLVLGPSLDRALAPRPDLAVVPNDVAFPYDRITQSLRKKDIPFVLLQEGIRFPLPGNSAARYGSGGAAAVAAWGPLSAKYFAGVGVPKEKVHLTGSPRFDALLAERNGRGEPGSPRAGERRLLVVTNPIDAQGYCTSQQKLELVRRFVDEVGPLLENRELALSIKLHAGESEDDYRRTLASAPTYPLIEFDSTTPLYSKLRASDAIVILASTVGLEALLLERSLGVLEIPGHGYAFDYVERGAATGLDWSRPMSEQVRKLVSRERQDIEAYLNSHLAERGSASRATARLIATLAGRQAGTEQAS